MASANEVRSPPTEATANVGGVPRSPLLSVEKDDRQGDAPATWRGAEDKSEGGDAEAAAGQADEAGFSGWQDTGLHADGNECQEA